MLPSWSSWFETAFPEVCAVPASCPSEEMATLGGQDALGICPPCQEGWKGLRATDMVGSGFFET